VANSTNVSPPRSRQERIQQDNCWHPELGVYFLPLEGLIHNFRKLLVRGVSHGLEETE
jgi:hypothetical protein